MLGLDISSVGLSCFLYVLSALEYANVLLESIEHLPGGSHAMSLNIPSSYDGPTWFFSTSIFHPSHKKVHQRLIHQEQGYP